jgi:peptidyl-prolyl cis-trans isomerase D
MMDFLRKQAQSTLIQAVVLIIAVVFIFWGVGSNLGGQRSTAASVNGTEISMQEFQRAYEQAAEGLRQQFGGQIPPDMLEKLGISEQVLHRLIQAELLRQGGEKMGITISGLPVQERIQQMAVFQKDGKFDLQRYKDILSQNRMTPKSFEEGMKSDLRADRVREQIGGFAVLSDSAVAHWQAFNGEEIKLAYVKLDPADFTAKVQSDEKELATWFEKNKDRYKSEPKVKLKYLLFDQAEDEKSAQVSDEELKARYEQDKAQYQQPERRRARHILFKVEKGAAEAARTETKRKAETVAVLTKAQGSDFAALAKQYSDDAASKEQGGDLGFFAAGRMVPTFDQAVFSMKAGEVSGLVETEFGWHIIKLEEIRPASERGFEQVKDSIAAGIRRQQAKGLAFKRAAAAYDAIMRAGSLDKYSQLEQGKVMSAEPFARSQPPAGLTAEPQFLDAAFKLKKGELSSIVELKGGYSVIFVENVQEPSLPELSAVREKALADWTKEKAAALAAKAAEDLLAASRQKSSLRETADATALKTSEIINRSTPGGKDGLPPQLVDEAFALSWKDKLPAKPMQAGDVWYVYEVAERQPGKPDPAQRDEARRQLLAESRYGLTSAWLHGLQAEAKIRINNALLK